MLVGLPCLTCPKRTVACSALVMHCGVAMWSPMKSIRFNHDDDGDDDDDHFLPNRVQEMPTARSVVPSALRP